ncbi:MAG: methyltransferase domain-containing protein [Bacteroidales bacterium]
MSNYYLASIYDFILYPFLNKTRQKTAKIINQLNPESLIDICCGTGNQLKYLNHTKIKLTGIDNSAEMLKAAKNLNCYNQDAREIQFPDKEFEMALIQLALHEKSFDDQKKIIEEIYRILKMKGYLVIMDYDIGNQTSKSAKYIINIIEYLAGKEHYGYFKEYHKNNGVTKLINTNHFKLIKKTAFAGKAMSLMIFQKQ